MTTSNTSGAASMRFSSDEVLSGMLGSTLADNFTDDATQLAAMFNDLSQRFTLFAQFVGGTDGNAVGEALEKLVRAETLQHPQSQYVLTAAGRNRCVSSKRTLFNSKDVQQLEEAARVFDGL